jgi:predicted MFS family arabinose efflux permease
VLLTGLLAAAVVLAFADASVVVLALPAMYGEYETTIVGVSWVITAYALVLAAAGFALAAAHRRGSARSLTAGGLALFGIASAVCAAAPGVGTLVAARCAQGLGGAFLLVGALDVLRRLDPVRGRRIWTTAGTVGLAVGPTLGGVLTDLFAWRTVFVVQAPVALLSLAILRLPASEAVSEPPDEAGEARREGGRSILANAGLLLVSGALVGALFLAVLLVIEVWQFTPIGGALVVSALPAGALVMGRWGEALGPATRAGGGCLLLAAGLVGLAILPSASPWWAAAALACCGAGFGLATGIFDAVAESPGVPELAPAGMGLGPHRDEPPGEEPGAQQLRQAKSHEDRALRRACALAIGSRHAGLVLGLALFAPLLSTDLDRAAEHAALTGARTLLDSRLNLSDKIDVARTLRDEVDATPRGEMPDLDRAFRDADADAAQAGVDLRRAIEAVLTRAFRTEFGVAAALALLGAVPALILARRMGRRRGPPGDPGIRHRAPLVAAMAVAGVALLAGEAAAGGWDFGHFERRDPCTATNDPYPGKGFDATLQRIVLSGLDGAACDLNVTREELVLSLDDKNGLVSIDWDRKTVQQAIRSGLVRAIDNAEDRGSVPRIVAGPLRELARRAPVEFALGTADVFRSGMDFVERGWERLKDLFN